jgi:chorismate synthase
LGSNTIGKCFSITLFGESHGLCVGVTVDGCPSGISLTKNDIQKELDKRKPVKDGISTPRGEYDKVEILSGIFNSYTTGAPISLIVWNKEFQSDVYKEFRWKPRPGHADYPATVRYGGYADYRGGGIFSGRLTIPFVAAGALAKKILRTRGIEVLANTVEVGGIKANQVSIGTIKKNVYTNSMRCADLKAASEMERAVKKAKSAKDSLGGIVECIVTGVPAGLGDPICNSLDADLAHFLFCIPAVKGVEIGVGFAAARLKGSENNDQYEIKNGKVLTRTNNAGGILGGLSNGMPLVVRIAFKPPASILQKQKTVDLKTMKETELEIRGRYDACVVPRAVPVVEAVVANVLADHLLILEGKGGGYRSK